MLQIKKLNMIHKKDLRTILDGFNLVLNDGDKAVIIGEEGNGKSTLMKWIYDPALIEDYVEANGERVSGNERMGYLPQELPDCEKDKTLYEYFSEENLFWNQTPKELAMLARKFGMKEDVSILLLDEPSNDIDITTLEILERMINDWEYIVVYISHDETLIENTANMVIHIEQIVRKTKSRYTVSRLSYRDYVEERMHQFGRQEQKALTERKEKKIRDEKYRRVYQKVHNALESCSRQSPGETKNLKDKMHTVKAMERRFEKADENMTEMPEQEEAIFFKLGDDRSAIPAGKTVIEYRLPRLESPDGERILSENISLKIRGPEKVCIVGHNGIGKTTLLRKIATELFNRTDIHV